MATIDDFGDVADPLGQPQLGGPQGWAAAVRDYIKDLPSDIAGLVTDVAGKMSASGGYFSGRFGIKQGSVDGILMAADTDFGPAGPTLMVLNEQGNAYAQVAVNPTPAHAQHAASKGYVDAKVASGWGFQVGIQENADAGTRITFPRPFLSGQVYIFLTPIDSTVACNAQVLSADANGFTVAAHRSDSGAIYPTVLYWLAYGVVA